MPMVDDEYFSEHTVTLTAQAYGDDPEEALAWFLQLLAAGDVRVEITHEGSSAPDVEFDTLREAGMDERLLETAVETIRIGIRGLSAHGRAALLASLREAVLHPERRPEVPEPDAGAAENGEGG